MCPTSQRESNARSAADKLHRVSTLQLIPFGNNPSTLTIHLLFISNDYHASRVPAVATAAAAGATPSPL